jgi:hypothetical protein
MQQLPGSTKRVKAGNGQAAAAWKGVFVQGYFATQAAITSPSRACTPIYRCAATPVTLWECRYRHMSPTHNRDGARRVYGN